MTVTQITMDNVLELLAEAVATRGKDYVYENHFSGCRYVVDGEPACLIGVLLHRVGVDLRELINRCGVYSNTHAIPTEDLRVVGVLSAAQAAQDGGHSWGKALAYARLQHFRERGASTPLPSGVFG